MRFNIDNICVISAIYASIYTICASILIIYANILAIQCSILVIQDSILVIYASILTIYASILAIQDSICLDKHINYTIQCFNMSKTHFNMLDKGVKKPVLKPLLSV